MKPAPFKYLAAESLAHALALKAEHGDEAHFLAGGQSLVPTMNFRLAQPAVLIDINPIETLSGLSRVNGYALRIGALTRYRMLERDVSIAETMPLIAEALPHIAHPQIRNRGTIGGNLSHADPASELPAIVVALQGKLRAQSVRGERWIAASDFFQGPLTTALAVDEMLTDIELPVQPARSGSCFMEVARRKGDFALLGIAIVVTVDEAGACTRVRAALCGGGETPVDVSEAAAVLIGRQDKDAAITDAAAAVRQAIDPSGNMHADPEYQRHLAGVLATRALTTAMERALHG
ncbi:xanthine dehydrogenase family protein subunit M [Microbacteriaceae bacterium K1510]|nr:xanthine dehydrogenase family protein subunit M [Microbacteriaceae bacterium K1510]